MPQSLSQVILHLVFSTKDRYPWLQDESRSRVHAYLAELCRKDLSAVCHRVGGVADHVHIVVSLPRTIPQSLLVENLKKKSSKWLKEIAPRFGQFYWQRGYGAFSVSVSNLTEVIHYVSNQDEHHKKLTFQDEYRLLLKKHEIDWDERYVWD